MAQAKMTQAFFSIDGEGITQIARSRVLSGDAGHAYRILQCLKGAEAEIVDVLSGKKTLVGTSDGDGIHVIAREDAGYQRTLRKAYAGRVRIDGRWWRPSKRVRHVEADAKEKAYHKLKAKFDAHEPDGRDPARSFAEAKELLTQWYIESVGYYARKDEMVVRVTLDGQLATVIFEATGEPPFFWVAVQNPADAIAEYLAAGNELREVKPRPPRAKKRSRDREAEMTGIGQAFASAFTRLARGGSATEVDADDEATYAERRAAHHAQIAEAVRKQAGDDWIELKGEGIAMVRVPRAPFMRWALRTTSLKELAPPWTPISPSGLKMMFDCPDHSDWMLGAGLSLDNPYSGPVYQAAIEEMFAIQRRLGRYECAVIVGGDDVVGTVGHDIAVVPDLSPERVPLIASARAIITEAGGATAHIAQIGREKSLPILRVSDATKRFQKGLRLHVRPSVGQIDYVHRSDAPHDLVDDEEAKT